MHKIKKNIGKFIPERFKPVIKRNAGKILYYGNTYYCPLCNSNTRLQKTFGLNLPVIKEKQIIGGGMRSVLCPICNSSDRVRLLYLFIKDKTNLFSENVKLLHVAPEAPLEYLFRREAGIDYLTADLMDKDVMVKMDLTKIQYPEGTFDAIICNHVLEHIPDDAKAMAEIFRVLKPGGWAILQVPISLILDQTFEDPKITKPSDRKKFFGQSDHVRVYGQDYTTRLKKAGFDVLVYNWSKDPDFNYEPGKLNINPRESVFYCTKPK
ncbi:MAG: methyltransferase domain-containing protein [Bacteroidales bacterium]|nr:methyltransferase domain-containing protein [Bacteroidales bacterium]MCF8403519.1 methyltransferase domain-containing protein [Bacteroidales bacterium]